MISDSQQAFIFDRLYAMTSFPIDTLSDVLLTDSESNHEIGNTCIEQMNSPPAIQGPLLLLI